MSGSASSSAHSSLIISAQKTSLPKCSLNVLPCHINHTGPVDASARHWQPRTEQVDKDIVTTSYFRGRKLCGRKVVMPEGYEGTILKKTERTSKLSTRAANEQDTEDDDDDDDVKMHVVDKVARFDHVTIWDHEAVPDQLEDSHVKGVAEWIKFAGAIHDFEDE